MTKVINTINNDILSENICFIPTMGAIHEGHLSLVDIGKETNLKTLVSIFLNRRQFNNDDDFKNYPIELEQDIEFLKSNRLFNKINSITLSDFKKELRSLNINCRLN